MKIISKLFYYAAIVLLIVAGVIWYISWNKEQTSPLYGFYFFFIGSNLFLIIHIYLARKSNPKDKEKDDT